MSIPADATHMDPAEFLADLELGWVSRYCDDKEISLQKQNRVFFQISGAGHEALLTGLARHLRPGRDWFFPYYRDRSLVLGLGVTPTEILLQSVGAASDPASGGRQMPCHWGDRGRHIVSQTSATGSQCLPAVGCAEAGRYLVDHPGIDRATASIAAADEITYVSLGEGTTSQGEFWEALNSATTLQLPVLFLVADNGWAISVPSSDQHRVPISDMVSGFDGLRVERVDGCDYPAVRACAAAVTSHLRSGGGPVLLHASVTRPYSHSAADTQSKYRTAADLADEASRDPLTRMEALAVAEGLLDASGVIELRERAKATVDAAAAEALAAPLPDPSTVTHHIVALPTWPSTDQPDDASNVNHPPSAHDGEPLTMADSINRALHELLAADERIRVFGEDVADAPADHADEVPGKGGVFGTTLGLQRRFGADRCYNSPLAEANIVGRAIGQAVRGLRPCPEVQFFDYVWTAMQQIKTEAATLRWRSNGSWNAPMVLRIPIGGYLTGGAIWHSQSGESIFTHVPGLLVAMPSRAADAVGLLRAAFLCEDPVLFLEHKHLYRQPYARDPYPADGWVVPFGHGVVRRPGTDLTVVTWGATVQKSIEAADLAAAQGIEAEIIDLRTLVPWDQELLAASVARTGRLVVVHEDIQTGGFGAEIAAWAASELWYHLRAPIARVAALDTHVAYAPALEEMILPQVADVLAAILDTARA